MRVTARRDVLLEALSKAMAAVPIKCCLPVLGNILLEARKGEITITGYNLETAVIVSCKAEVRGTGKVVFSPKPVLNFLKAVSNEVVTLRSLNKVEHYEKISYERNPESPLETKQVSTPATRTLHSLEITAGSASSKVDTSDPKDFPPIPKVTGKPDIRITDFGKALNEVLYAVSRDNCRPVLAGICLTPQKGHIKLAAADGFRLAVTSARCKGELPEQAILPSSAATLIKRLLPGVVTVTAHRINKTKTLLFQQNGAAVLTQLIEGTYPDYAQLIPKKGKLLKVSTCEIQKAVKLAATTGADCVRLLTRGNNLKVSSNMDGGTSTVTIPSTGTAKIAFDIRYLKELLDHAGETLEMRTQSPSSPAVVKSNGTVHVLMPRHVQW